jgi:hypothetical protein
MFIPLSINTNYSVNEEGVVINTTTGKIMAAHYHKDGYKKLRIPVDGVSKHQFIHRLVAAAFIPNPDNKPQVNHIDGVRDNNHVSNLEWVTGQENTWHIGHRTYFERIQQLYNEDRTISLDAFMMKLTIFGYKEKKHL